MYHRLSVVAVCRDRVFNMNKLNEVLAGRKHKLFFFPLAWPFLPRH